MHMARSDRYHGFCCDIITMQAMRWHNVGINQLIRTFSSAAKQQIQCREWLLAKGVSIEAGNGVIKSLEATPGLSATVRTLESLGETGLKALVDAVEREQQERSYRNAGKKAVTLYVDVPHERDTFTCSAVEGENLQEVAERETDTLGRYLECACGGIAACSTCHVIVSTEHFGQLEPADEAELDMIDLAYGVTDTSRLGCQLVLSADNIHVTIPDGVNNHF